MVGPSFRFITAAENERVKGMQMSYFRTALALFGSRDLRIFVERYGRSRREIRSHSRDSHLCDSMSKTFYLSRDTMKIYCFTFQVWCLNLLFLLSFFSPFFFAAASFCELLRWRVLSRVASWEPLTWSKEPNWKSVKSAYHVRSHVLQLLSLASDSAVPSLIATWDLRQSAAHLTTLCDHPVQKWFP